MSTTNGHPAHNGTLPDDARGAAAFYLAHDAVPVPNGFQTKKPLLKEWQKLLPRAEDLDRLFPPQHRRNIGLSLGAPSKGLLDVDLDCPQAVAAGGVLLPATGWVSGRQGSPRSHWWYRVANPPDKASDAYKDLDDNKKLVELRSTGGQTVVPPSVWRDDPAALALWEYAQQSVRYVFGDSLGSPLADDLLRLLRASPDGLTRNSIMDHFGRHQSSAKISQALALLAENGLARMDLQNTGGRPAERWFGVVRGR
jgi:hypothetical protein